MDVSGDFNAPNNISISHQNGGYLYLATSNNKARFLFWLNPAMGLKCPVPVYLSIFLSKLTTK